MSQRVLLVGEPMGLFIADQEGPLDSVSSYTFAVAGAEFNVAVGLVRQRHGVGFLTKLGPDPFGSRIVRLMEDNGFDTSMIVRTQAPNSGFMLKSNNPSGDPEIYYFRKGSAASTLSPEDIDGLDFSEYSFLHMTGILPALSDSTRAATFRLLERAREAGITVSFDSNLRPQLWPDERTMIESTNAFASMADIFMPGIGECEILMGSRDEREAAQYYLDHGAKLVIVKLGANGAYYASADGESGHVPGFKPDRIVDTVGAGDGFASGVIAGLREGLSVEDAVRRGNAIGAIQLMSRSDNEGLPTREELAAFMGDLYREGEAI